MLSNAIRKLTPHSKILSAGLHPVRTAPRLGSARRPRTERCQTMLSSAETQWGVLTWAGLLVLVSLFVVVAVLALNSTVTALQHGAARAKLNAPPTQPFRDVDGATSGDQLAQQAQCPRTPPSGLVTRVGGSIQPFIVLHELHVGELWLVKLLQACPGSPRHPHARHRHDAGAPLAGADRRARAGGASQGRQGPEGSARVALCCHERRVATRCVSITLRAHPARRLASAPLSARRSDLPTALATDYACRRDGARPRRPRQRLKRRRAPAHSAR